MSRNRGTFFERIDFLAKDVGFGDLVGTVEVDQVYAHYQHEHAEFRHPRGGQAFYLSAPFFDKTDERMEKLALRAITPNGSDLTNAMADAMEDLSDDVFKLAPVEFADLKNSGHPSVRSDGVIVYDRPPAVHRLTEEELKAKSKLRGHGLRRHGPTKPRFL